MASLRGFEPPAYRLGGGRSVQLSYSDSAAILSPSSSLFHLLLIKADEEIDDGGRPDEDEQEDEDDPVDAILLFLLLRWRDVARGRVHDWGWGSRGHVKRVRGAAIRANAVVGGEIVTAVWAFVMAAHLPSSSSLRITFSSVTGISCPAETMSRSAIFLSIYASPKKRPQ